MKTLQSASTKISLNDAVVETTNWRNFLSDVLKLSNSSLIARGVYIPKEDLEGLYKILSANDQFTGARAYFALDQDHEVWPYNKVVKVVLVPVEMSKEFPNGKDVLIKPGGDRNSPGDSNIYDFTMPCPDSCDVNSELYGMQPARMNDGCC